MGGFGSECVRCGYIDPDRRRREKREKEYHKKYSKR